MKQVIWSKCVHFKPWIGDNFNSGVYGGLKVLVLGNSHYFRPENKKSDGDRRLMTQCVIKDAIRSHRNNERDLDFFDRVKELLSDVFARLGKIRAAGSGDHPFHRIAFFNYLQKEYDAARRKRTSLHYAESAPAFAEVVEKLSPNRVLVLGRETWQSMSETTPPMSRIPSNLWSASGSELWRIDIPPRSLMAHVIHPSYSMWNEHLEESKGTFEALLRFPESR